MLNYAIMTTETRANFGLEDTLHRKVGELVLDKMIPISIKDVAAEKESTGGDMDLYVHIPFCTEICSFCAFHRKVGDSKQQEAYTTALQGHIDDVLTPFGEDQVVSSIFVGGGTPGLLTVDQAGRIISKIRGTVDAENALITYELHPENITEEYIRGLQGIGVGRFSVGVQTLADDERKTLGRDLTTAEEDIAKLHIMNQLGVLYNLDLMFGTPAQTPQSWIDTVSRIGTEVAPPEITVYQYVNAYGSATRKWIAEGRISRPDLRTRRGMYSEGSESFAASGYRQTSTYSFSRDQSIRDRALLNHGSDFLGLGPRTYSRVGRNLFINNARTSDYTAGRNMADYYGVRVPSPVMTALDRTFGLFARGDRKTDGKTGPIVRGIKSEAVAQVYGVLYYLINQPNLATREQK